MRMAGFYDESMSNGIGWRAVLFVSGCPHNCPGCHNKVAQDFNYGEEFDETAILERIKENSILKGITISGGEPLCPENINDVNKFIERVRKELPELNIWCYSGYTFEELKNRNDKITDITLNNIDVLVDGRFIEERKNPEIKFRGSDNQRIIDLRKSLKENRIVELDI